MENWIKDAASLRKLDEKSKDNNLITQASGYLIDPTTAAENQGTDEAEVIDAATSQSAHTVREAHTRRHQLKQKYPKG